MALMIRRTPLRKAIAFAFLTLASIELYAGDALSPEVVQREARLIATVADAVRRTNEHLRLALDNGRSKVLTSKETCEGPDDCLIYRFEGMAPIGRFFVVSLGAWEDWAVYWIARASGARFDVYDFPHVSPDGRHIATAVMSEGGGTNGVFVWQVSRDALALKFRHEPEEYALYEFSRWIASNEVELKKTSHAHPKLCPAGAQIMTRLVYVRQSGSGWRLDEPLVQPGTVCH